MIIWIDGVRGVGKTKVCEELMNAKINYNFELLNSDQYYINMIKRNAFLALNTGALPQNNKNFIIEFRNVIKSKIKNEGKNLIIDMALTEKECKDGLIDSLKKDGINILHIILTASKENLIDRIRNDSNRDKEDALNLLENNLKFLETEFSQDEWIETDNKCISDIVKEIIIIEKRKHKY